MREIKFRVWDKKRNQFIKTSGSDTNNGFDILLINEYLPFIKCPNINVFNDNFIIQQFTGLVDDNNKEIYEGDILTGRKTPIVVKYDAPEYIFEYKNIEGGFFTHLICGWKNI